MRRAKKLSIREVAEQGNVSAVSLYTAVKTLRHKGVLPVAGGGVGQRISQNNKNACIKKPAYLMLQKMAGLEAYFVMHFGV